MKRFLIALLGVAVSAVLAGTALAQGNPRGTTKFELKGKEVSIEYGRPSLKGRTVQQMFDQLKPGDFWRLGADKSTTFSTGLDLAFGDVTIPAGEYSLWAQKQSGGGWKLVFNKQHGQWGTRHDPAQDFATAALMEMKAAKAAEMLTIAISRYRDLMTSKYIGGVVSIRWGDIELDTPFKPK